MSTSTPISEPTDIDMDTRMHEFVDAVIGGRDLDAVETFVAPEFVLLGASEEDRFEGIEGARTYFEGLLGAFSDLRLEIEDLLVDVDTDTDTDADAGRLMFRYVASGIHDGDLPLPGGETLPATGESATWQGFGAARFDDGRLTEARIIADQLGLLGQLGLAPDFAADGRAHTA